MHGGLIAGWFHAVKRAIASGCKKTIIRGQRAYSSVGQSRRLIIVGDTNLVVYLHVESEFTARARQVYAIDSVWVFPPVAHSEAANALTTLTREKWISAETALLCLGLIEPRIVAGFRDVPMKAVLQLATERGISAYDAQFIVLAMQLGISLVTEDGKLKKRFPGIAISMEPFIDGASKDTVRESRAAYGGRRKS